MLERLRETLRARFNSERSEKPFTEYDKAVLSVLSPTTYHLISQIVADLDVYFNPDNSGYDSLRKKVNMYKFHTSLITLQKRQLIHHRRLETTVKGRRGLEQAERDAYKLSGTGIKAKIDVTSEPEAQIGFQPGFRPI